MRDLAADILITLMDIVLTINSTNLLDPKIIDSSRL